MSERGATHRERDRASESSEDTSKGRDGKRRKFVGSTADYVDATPQIKERPVDESAAKPARKPDIVGKEEAPPRVAPQPAPDISPAGPEDPTLICITVKQETLVLSGLVLCSLLLGSFIFGHKVGFNKYRGQWGDEGAPQAMIPAEKRVKETTPAKPEPKPAAPRKAQAPAKAQGKAGSVYTLCVVSYKLTQRTMADDLVRLLGKAIPHQKVFLKRTTNAWTVCVGYFPGQKDSDLIELRDAIRRMIYQGKQQFGDCYPMRLSS